MSLVYTLILILSFHYIISATFQPSGHSRSPQSTARSNLNFVRHAHENTAAVQQPSRISLGSQKSQVQTIDPPYSTPPACSLDSLSLFTTDTTTIIQSESDRRNTENIKRLRLIFTSFTVIPFLLLGSECMAVERAVGSAEQKCREAGNCLEKLELDGFIGWNWGGKDRCDPNDSRCGVDGTLRASAVTTKTVPPIRNDQDIPLKITDIINIRLSIGRKESGTLRIGLYGEQCPKSVQQLLAFCGDVGLITSDHLMSENGFDILTAPIRLPADGVLSMIYPEKRIEFGILSQSKAYAKSKRMSRAGNNFVAQPRPSDDEIVKEQSARSHKIAGLVSIPKNGLGYAGNLLTIDDEAFIESFGITATGDETLNQGRKVIGQLIDDESMAFLSRLSSLPTVKGLKGFVPGLTSGPPLLPVVVNEISIQANDDE